MVICILWLFAIALAVRLFAAWLDSPSRKGKSGERTVASRLRQGLPEEYIILNDVYLPLADGTTTQIDHIVVSQYGIFVVETKTYSGWSRPKCRRMSSIPGGRRTTSGALPRP